MNKKYQIVMTSLLFGLNSWGATVPMAHAKMENKNGSKVEGHVEFAEAPEGLKVTYDLAGLPPSQTLGFHIHERGDCNTPNFKSAGPHFAKVAATGGTSQDFPDKYAGDLQAITSDAEGKATGSFVASDLSIFKEHGIKGRSVIIHGGPDDINAKSAPRIACGIIRVGPKMQNRKDY